MVQVGEFERVTQKEHRRVVADQIPVAFLGVKLQCKAADVALGICRAAFSGDCGETGEHLGLLADLRKDFCPRVFRDVVSDGERAVSAAALGVHAPLGDHFAVEVGEFLQEPDILEQHRATRPGSQDILVVGDGSSGVRGQFFLFVFHGLSPFGF